MSFRYLCVTLVFFLSTGCGKQSTFKGTPSTGKAPASPSADVIPEPVVTPPPVIKTVDEVAKDPPVLAIPDPVQIPKVCKEKLDYDPSDILCALAIDGSHPNIWDGKTSEMRNQKAKWINPLATQKSVTNQDQCPFVPGSDQVLYVSNFTLTAEEEVLVESTVDDEGQVRLWKNADPKQEVYISTRGIQSSKKIKLAAGFYTVVIDVVDVYKGASGAVASVIDSKGAVIRQTEASSEWCIFRLTANRDIADFLLSTSTCRSCMVGTSPTNLLK